MKQDITYKVQLSIADSIAQAKKLQKTLDDLSKTPGATAQQRAHSTQLVEHERRLTAAARSESQARIALARAEGKEREYAAKAAMQAQIEAERRATAQIQAEQQARQQSARSSVYSPGIGEAIIGGVTGYLGIQGLQAIAQQAIALGDLQARTSRATRAFEILSGSAAEARSRLDAIKAGAGGAVTTLQALEVGTQASALGLAKTSEEFQKLTVAARAIAFISPTIKDVGSALTELALFSSNAASFARADQLGLSASEVKDRMRELREEFPLLDDSQLKLQTSIEILNQKYGELLSTTEAMPTGLERIRIAMAELRTEAAEPIGIRINFIAGEIADVLNVATGRAFDQSEVMAQIQRALPELEAQHGQAGGLFGMGGTTDNSAAITALKTAEQGLKDIQTAINAGVPGLEKYQEELSIIAVYTAENGKISDEWAEQVRNLSSIAADAVNNIGAMASVAEDFSQATVSPDVSAAIEAVRQQRELIQTFKELDILIADAAAFTPAQLPGADRLVQDLISLKIEIAAAGGATEEQSAALAEAERYLDSAAAAANFLANAENAAAIASGQFDGALASTAGYADALAMAAYRAGTALQEAFAIAGQLSGGITGGLTGLIGRGLIGAEQAGRIYEQQQLAARQGAYSIANSGASDVQKQLMQAELQYQLNEPIRVIEETERVRRENERKAAQEAERAMKGAAKGTQKAFEDVAKNLESDLRGIPGLFGTSDVTEADMLKAQSGLYQDKPDEWLRRLRDEVQNGKDYEDVSIEQAREALSRVGIVAAENAEDVLAQVEEAWNNSVLFSDKANLELINQDAVQMQLELKEKSRQGQQNIMEYFGVVVDEAVGAVTGGGGATPPKIEIPEIKIPEIEADPRVFADLIRPYTPPDPSTIQRLIGPLPGPPDPQQLALSGGTFAIEQITLPENLAADLAADIATQLSDQGDLFKGQGEDIARYQGDGYTGYERADHAQDYFSDIGQQFQEKIDLFKAQGGAIAYFHGQGYAEYQRADHAQDYFNDIGLQFQEKIEDFKGQGGAIAGLHEQGYGEYAWGDVAGTTLSAIDGQFFTKENKKYINSTGEGIAAEIVYGMAIYDYEASAKTILQSMRGGYSTEENLDIMLGIGGGVMTFIFEGMIREAAKPSWGSTLFDQITNTILSAAADSLETG